ncbi:bifunctional folylpolyglutamate synthase/dihydrofolate synthase [Sandaracinobacteroides saxicola]|uniref:Dihydrofolate synthase/folylpolyglutamate synthase n=1 Tax=Sandaracinobacteroides saxicola TaxID=2759707 RepID=A0A7G5IH29_9SPHN|nr:Mur ligase family protein [Sandaracinobacteroides saxicola]QMW22671.1 bifunctional folylpolyglutamate synthase/dihydrofolate synthase [Sandaracinobacteroides saxicola]
MDFARSDDPVLDRLLRAAGSLHVQGVDLTLSRIERLLGRIGSPQLKMPPVFHVAGTNGKGSSCAFLRAGLEAAGHKVHVYTSPHLCRVNERVRLAGVLAGDQDLRDALTDVLRFNADQPLSFFEAFTVAAFLLFAATPADAVVLEVGLGGRLDATNVIPAPAVTGIAQLAMDHVAILGPTIRHIAAEKAGIAKKGVPLVTQKYAAAVAAKVTEVAMLAGSPVMARGVAWDAAVYQGQFHLKDGQGTLTAPLPRLAGAHQVDNAALALAMLRAQSALPVPESAQRAALTWAEWPARVQRLAPGPLVPAGAEVWLDGGHNPAAGKAIAAHFGAVKPVLILGMLANKDADGFIRAFAGRVGEVIAVPIPGHDSHDPEVLAGWARVSMLPARTAAGLGEAVATALSVTAGPVLIAGSLHLAGLALSLNGQQPV